MLERGDKKKQMDKKLEKAHGQTQSYKAGVTPVGKMAEDRQEAHLSASQERRCPAVMEEAVGKRVITQEDFLFRWSQRAFKAIVAADETQTERKLQKENETSLTLRRKKAEVSNEKRP